MQLIFHGGSQEVGRSCVEIRTGNDRYLLDCGLKFHDQGFDYPAKIFESRALDAVFLSHAHLDHSGGLPFFEHYHMSCPIFCMPDTKAMVKVLLKDSWRITKIKHLCEAFSKRDLKRVFRDMRTVSTDKEQHFRSITYKYVNAGHIPGSAGIKIRAENTNILYTGDYNTLSTELMAGADPRTWGDVDVLITESTYGARNHPNREELQEQFLAKVEEVLKRGGRVLVPVFAVGRAQEILIMLSKKKWNVPIYADGMVKKITNITLRSSSKHVRNKKQLERLFKKVRRVKSMNQREKVADTKGIFVTTSGMLQGGPALSYIQHIWDDPSSAILLTGYQVQNTNGWFLDTKKTMRINGEIKKVLCDVVRYDFSAHLSRQDIEKTIMTLKPKIVIFMHGAPEAINALKEWTESETQSKVYTPSVGDQIDLSETGTVSHKKIYAADDGYRFPEEHQHGETCTPAMYDDFESDD